jgi:hypothetical protein
LFQNGACVIQCLASTCSPLCPNAASPTCPDPANACDLRTRTCLPKEGSKCVSSQGRCGACVKSCGNGDGALTVVCPQYGISDDNKECNVSAVGGGGRCAGTVVCCSVVFPYDIKPDANGVCPARAN